MKNKWIRGSYLGFRAYFFSDVYIIRKNDKKWEVMAEEGYCMRVVTITSTRKRAMKYGEKLNKQLNPVHAPLRRLVQLTV